LLNACWEPDTTKRPNTTQILDQIASCKADFKQRQKEWNSCILIPSPTSSADVVVFTSESSNDQFDEGLKEPSPIKDPQTILSLSSKG